MDGIYAVKITQGKRVMALDLTTEDGQVILRKLIARADALVHNYRGAAPERLGIDYASVRTINSNLVYLYAGSYGSSGPNAGQRVLE